MRDYVEFAKSEIETTLHGRFERIAATLPENFAVTTRSERVNYRDLNAIANRVAQGFGPTQQGEHR